MTLNDWATFFLSIASIVVLFYQGVKHFFWKPKIRLDLYPQPAIQQKHTWSVEIGRKVSPGVKEYRKVNIRFLRAKVSNKGRIRAEGCTAYLSIPGVIEPAESLSWKHFPSDRDWLYKFYSEDALDDEFAMKEYRNRIHYHYLNNRIARIPRCIEKDLEILFVVEGEDKVYLATERFQTLQLGKKYRAKIIFDGDNFTERKWRIFELNLESYDCVSLKLVC
jgi:hypothetical protein